MMTFCSHQLYSNREESTTHVCGIPYHLVLDFLPPFQTLLNQDLGTETKTPRRQIPQLLLVMGKTRS